MTKPLFQASPNVKDAAHVQVNLFIGGFGGLRQIFCRDSPGGSKGSLAVAAALSVLSAGKMPSR